MTGASGLGTWVKESVAPVLVSESASSYQKDQCDRKPIGSLELHGRKGSWRGLKYPRRTSVGEMTGLWKGGQVLTGSQLRKGPIKSGKFSDGSDTFSGHAPVQGTQLRS